MISRCARRGIALLLLALAPTAAAQQIADLPRVAYVLNASRDPGDFRIVAFRRGLRDLGYVEDQTISIDYFYYDSLDQLPQVVTAVVASEPDVIMALFTPAALALKRATTTIPIVFANVTDPVASGIVTSLARPGGNITGVSLNIADRAGKTLELLTEFMPRTGRIAVLYNANNPSSALPQVDNILAAGRTLEVELMPFAAEGGDDWDRVLGDLAGRVQALVFIADYTYTNNVSRIVDALQRYGLPAMFGVRNFVEAGGLISYGVNYTDHHMRAAAYVARILEGANPGDLAVEQPRELELVINKRTADALGLTIPEELMLLATEIIE